MGLFKGKFEKVLETGTALGFTGKDAESRKWFRAKAQSIARPDSPLATADKTNLMNSWTNIAIGKLYMFYYDPKLKIELPYYDKFPLIFPIGKYEDGFLGINLHYISPRLRAKLMDALYETMNNDKYNQKTKLQISYDILNGASKYKYFKPCVKRYLGQHVRSRFLYVPPPQWEMTIMLPWEQFEKANKQTVWAESLKMIR